MFRENDVLTLGSGTLINRRIGPRAVYLDRARENKLPVPPGVIITEELVRECYSSVGSTMPGKRGKNRKQNVRLVREEFLRDRLLTALPLLNTSKWKQDLSGGDGRFKVAIRPVFSLADGGNEPPPGLFHTELGVEGSSAIMILDSIKSVLASAHAYEQAMYADEIESGSDDDEDMPIQPRLKGHNLRRDVLLMPMVAARHSGIGFLQHDYEEDVIMWNQGYAQDLTNGEIEGETLLLARLRSGERVKSKAEQGFENRLQSLLYRIRLVFGESRDWEIEWADDGEDLWLLQIRPLNRTVPRTELLSNLLESEICPQKLSRFGSSLYLEAANRAFSFLKVLCPAFPVRRELVKDVNGNLYINVSLLLDYMRILGLPAKYVLDVLVPETYHELFPRFGWNLRRFVSRLPVLWRLWQARMRLGATVDQNTVKLVDESRRLNGSVKDNLQNWVRSLADCLSDLMLLNFALLYPVRKLYSNRVLDIWLSRFKGVVWQFYKKLIAIKPETKAQTEDVVEDSTKKESQKVNLLDEVYIDEPTLNSLKTIIHPTLDPARKINWSDLDIRHKIQSALKRKDTIYNPVSLTFKALLNYLQWYKVKKLLLMRMRIANAIASSNQEYHMFLESKNIDSDSIWDQDIQSLQSDQQTDQNRDIPATKSTARPQLILEHHFEQSPEHFQNLGYESVTIKQSSLKKDIKAALYSNGYTEEISISGVAYTKKAYPAGERNAFICMDQLSMQEWYTLPDCSGIIHSRFARFSPLSLRLRETGIRTLINKAESGSIKSGSQVSLNSVDGSLKIENQKVSQGTVRKKKAETTSTKKPSKKKSSNR